MKGSKPESRRSWSVKQTKDWEEESERDRKEEEDTYARMQISIARFTRQAKKRKVNNKHFPL